MSGRSSNTAFFRLNYPLRVLLKTKGMRSLAVIPYDEKDASVLVMEGKAVKFIQASQFDNRDFYSFTECFGCIGIVNIEEEVFVGFITTAEIIGEIDGSQILKVIEVRFFSLTSSDYDDSYARTDPSTGNPLSHPCEDLQKYCSTGTFYFSRQRDLTLSFQRTYELRERYGETKPWSMPDKRFLWNKYLLNDLMLIQNHDIGSFDKNHILVPLIQGYIGIDQVVTTENSIGVTVISRLSCERAGTRFNTRGVGDNGHVANFVETEQIVSDGNIFASFVQVRGSVPVFWEQKGLQVGGHRIELSRGKMATKIAFKRHFDEQINIYGTQRIVNLLSQKGGEAFLSEEYEYHINNHKNPLIKYTHFDFHQMCKNENYQNLSLLIREIEQDLKMFQFFLYDMKMKKPVLFQKGVFRTNCVDCLDRTNLVQSAIAKHIIDFQMGTLGINITGGFFFTKCLGEIWANNGDTLSKIYAGTGALKSEFTRTGKRTITGMMDDVVKNVNRFYVNNFLDDSKQETINLLLGKDYTDQKHRSLIYHPLLKTLEEELKKSEHEYSSFKKVNFFVGTWNVSAKKAPGADQLNLWLKNGINSTLDMYIIGFQELVPLSAKKVIHTDGTERRSWEDQILESLNQDKKDSFILLRSEQLVGACICIFVKTEYIEHIKFVETSVKKTGFSGMAGNKGGVSIRLDIYSTSFCFVCCHFAAGQKEVEERNRDYNTINDGILFNYGWAVEDHDNIVWLGDFNYRIDLPNDEVRRRVSTGDFNTLLRYDQLSNSRKEGKVFQFYTEGEIFFNPTYKYDFGKNVYDTSEKMRTPSWTDRILWLGGEIYQTNYGRSELTYSDHRPVRATFEAQVTCIDENLKSQIKAKILNQGPIEYSEALLKSFKEKPRVFQRKKSNHELKIQDLKTQNLIDIESTESLPVSNDYISNEPSLDFGTFENFETHIDQHNAIFHTFSIADQSDEWSSFASSSTPVSNGWVSFDSGSSLNSIPSIPISKPTSNLLEPTKVSAPTKPPKDKDPFSSLPKDFLSQLESKKG